MSDSKVVATSKTDEAFFGSTSNTSPLTNFDYSKEKERTFKNIIRKYNEKSKNYSNFNTTIFDLEYFK